MYPKRLNVENSCLRLAAFAAALRAASLAAAFSAFEGDLEVATKAHIRCEKRCVGSTAVLVQCSLASEKKNTLCL